MADKYLIQQRTATGLETIAELPVLENGKVDIGWLPIVGTMESSVIESGSNANGSYTKFADGTMICYHYFQSLPIGGNNRRVMFIWTYPATFSANTYVFGTPNTGNLYDNATNVDMPISFLAERSDPTSTSMMYN